MSEIDEEDVIENNGGNGNSSNGIPDDSDSKEDEINSKRDFEEKNVGRNSEEKSERKRKVSKEEPMLIFPDDFVVSHKRKKKKKKRNLGWVFTRTGIVQSVGGELDQSEYESDSELEEEQIRVTFLNDQRDRVVRKSAVKVVDRSFSHGDVVKHVKEFPKGQAGVVRDVKLKFDIQYVNACKNINHDSSLNHVVFNVPGHWLHRHPFQKKYLAVYRNRFVCYVSRVYFDVELVFRKANDQKCILRNVDPDIFFSDDENERILDDSYPFRLHQNIKVSRLDRKRVEFLKNGEWLSGVKFEPKIHKFAKVRKVTPTKVDLRKIFTRPNKQPGKDDDEDRLDEFLLIPVEKIRPYQYFNYSKWGVGEFGFVNHPESKLRSLLGVNGKISRGDIPSYDPSKFPHSFDYVCDEKYFRQIRHNNLVNLSTMVDPSRFIRVISSQTFIDVHWQDGSVSLNLPSVELCPFSHVQTKDFYPGDTVRFVYPENLIKKEEEEEESDGKKKSKEEEGKMEKKEIGTIVSMDHSDKLCKVLGFHRKEVVEVSCFDLEEEENFHFDLGDVVVDLRVTMNSDNVLVEKKKKDVGWTGEVVGLSSEHVRVFWNDTHRTSEIRRDSLLNLSPLVEEIEDEESDEEYSSDDDDEEDSEDSEEEEGESEDDGEREGSSKSTSSSSSSDSSSSSSSESESESESSTEDENINDWVSKIRKKEMEEEEEEEEKEKIEKEVIESKKKEEKQELDGEDEDPEEKEEVTKTMSDQEIEKNEKELQQQQEKEEEEEEEEEKKFFLIPEFKFHKYLYKNYTPSQSSTSTRFLKRVGKEIRMFQKNRVLSTTKNMYVICSRNRMDLFRFIIFGSKFTPYYNGTLIFDLYLNPSTYPTKPPKVKFYSKGVEINPNLYKDGKICLSLLNTWHGKNRGESWIPGVSNIFQIVQSIQSFILNESPWFNEAGHDRFKTQKFDEQSRMFNYEAIINMIKHQTKQYDDLTQNGIGEDQQKKILLDHINRSGGEMMEIVKKYSRGEIQEGEEDVLNVKKSSRGFEKSLMRICTKYEASIRKFLKSSDDNDEKNNEEGEEENGIEKKE